MLDLQSKRWTTKGKYILTIDNLEDQINTPWGILGKGKENHTSFILLDLKRNRILNLSKSKSQEIINRENWDTKYFFKDSSLFIVTDSLYKISLRITDFEATSHGIYEETGETTFLFPLQKIIITSWKLIAGMTICLLIGFMGATLLQKKNSPKNFGNGSLSRKSAIPVFDEKEKGLIKLIFENSLAKHSTSIEDINKILGLSDKPNDLQKKHRSDTISSINQKYHYITNSEGLLLKKYRSEIDKRSFEYFIDFEDYQKLDGIL